MTGVTEASMPKGRGTSNKRGSGGGAQRVERTGALTADENPPRLQILHRTTSGVKLNRTVVIGSELAHRNQVLNEVR
jgi:hypothetical protein